MKHIFAMHDLPTTTTCITSSQIGHFLSYSTAFIRDTQPVTFRQYLHWYTGHMFSYQELDFLCNHLDILELDYKHKRDMYVVLYANKDIGSLRKKHDFGFVISCFVCLCYQLINEYGLQESNRVVK